MALRPKYFKPGDWVWYKNQLAKVESINIFGMTVIIGNSEDRYISFRDSSGDIVRRATKAESILYSKGS